MKCLALPVVAIWFVMVLAGCGQELPPEADKDKARQALTTALETWKKGEPMAALQQLAPPIVFTCNSWQKGDRLSDYSVLAAEPVARSIKFKVKLSIDTKDGQRLEEETELMVDTDPRIVIVPAEL